MEINISKSNIIIDGTLGKIKIPSQKFPLKNDHIKIFHNENTENCHDKKVLNIYNSIDFKLGKCFNNTKMMIDIFNINEIKNVEAYAGWLFVGYDFPIWHSFCVYKENIILDFISDLKHDTDIGKYDGKNIKGKYINFYKNQSQKSNIERFGAGQVDKLYLYIATKCSPDEAIGIFEKLQRSYPKHPSYKTFGTTELQKELIKLT